MKNPSMAAESCNRYERDHRARRMAIHRPSEPSTTALLPQRRSTKHTSSMTSRAPRGSSTSSPPRSTSAWMRLRVLPSPATPSPCNALPSRRQVSLLPGTSPRMAALSDNRYGGSRHESLVSPRNVENGSAGNRLVRGGSATVVTLPSASGTAARRIRRIPSRTSRNSTVPLSWAIDATYACAFSESATGVRSIAETGASIACGTQRASRAAYPARASSLAANRCNKASLVRTRSVSSRKPIAKRSSKRWASRSLEPMLRVSCSASAVRARTVASHVSVDAPAPATTATVSTCGKPRRMSAVKPIAALHGIRYQSDQIPAPVSRTGARPALANESATGQRAGTPRWLAMAARPTDAMASRSAAPASAMANCQDAHSTKPAPVGGSEIPRARSRNRNGPLAAPASTTNTATTRERRREGPRFTNRRTVNSTVVVNRNPATVDVSGPPIA